MLRFLCFRLHGPLASWGEIAVGERRPSSPHPSRSAVLGLLGAALGLRRDDEAALSGMEASLGFASRTDAPGELLLDFHTAQGPEEKLLRASAGAARKAGRSWHRPATRRDELAYGRRAVGTLLSTRQYRADALWVAAVWLRPGREPHAWSLPQLTEALRRPRFLPYLGRKSCPLDVPMEPQIIEADDPVAAMARARFQTNGLLAPVLSGGRGRATVQWEGTWPGLEAMQTAQRRDRVLSRARWQFNERQEHQAAWFPTEEDEHVPEPD